MSKKASPQADRGRICSGPVVATYCTCISILRFSPFLLLPATASPPGVLRVHSKEGGSSGEPGACRSVLPLRPYPRWLSRGGTGALGLPTGFGDFRQIHPKTTKKNEQEHLQQLFEEPRLLSTQMDVMEVPVLLIRVRGTFYRYLRGGQ